MNKTINWNSHPLFNGTVILTATGLASRIIGFLYRIFLTHTIGATGLGIYQLTFPIFTLGLSICTGGIQTAISKYTAEEKNNKILKKTAPIADAVRPYNTT